MRTPKSQREPTGSPAPRRSLSSVLTTFLFVVAVIAFGVGAGIASWRAVQQANQRSAEAWEKSSEAIEAEARIRTAMGDVLLKMARGLREVEVGDPEALSETFTSVTDAIRRSALDPVAESKEVDRADTLLREMGETLLFVDEIDGARELATAAVDVAQKRLDVTATPEAKLALARARVLIGRIDHAAGETARARETLVEARSMMVDVLDSEPDDPAVQAGLARALLPLAEILHDDGEREVAVAMADSAAELWQTVSETQRLDASWLPSRARILERLALWRMEGGQFAPAREASELAVAIRRDVVEQRPRSREAKRSLAEALVTHGQAELAAGNAEAANGALWEGYSLQLDLRREDGDRTAPFAPVATLESLGAARGEAGDSEVAVQFMQEAVRLRREVAAENSDDKEAQTLLALSLVSLGDAWEETGALGAALDRYEESLRILERFNGQDSEDPAVRAAVATALQSIGDLRMGEGEAHGAMGYFTEVLRIRRELMSGSAEVVSRTELAETLEEVGDGSRATGDLAAGREVYAEALAIRRSLLEESPESRSRRRDVMQVLMHMGDLELKLGDPQAAAPLYTEAGTIIETLNADGAKTPQLLGDLADSMERVGDMAMQKGTPAEALPPYRRALEIRQGLAGADTGRAAWPVVLAATHARIGDALRATGDDAGAAEEYGKCAAPLRELSSGDQPSTPASRQLGLCLYRIAVVTEGPARRAAEAEAEEVLAPLADNGLLPAETTTEIEELRSTLSSG